MSREHSAEWLRGAISILKNSSNRTEWIQLEQYKALLRAAEDREAGKVDGGELEVQRKNNLRLLDEWRQAESKLANAAEVIVGVKKALDTFARAYRVSMKPFGLKIDQADGARHWIPGAWPTVKEFKDADDAIAAIAKWEESRNV